MRVRRAAQPAEQIALPGLALVVVPPPTETKPTPVAGGIYAITRAELEQARRIDSIPGQIALLMAKRLDQDRDTGAGAVALSKQLREVMDRALADVPKTDDLLNDLERRRQQKIQEAQ